MIRPLPEIAAPETCAGSEPRGEGAPTPAGAALYTGTIRHRRSAPVANSFRYGVYQVLLDLDEIADLATRVPFLGHNRFNLTAFYDRDHMGPEELPVRVKLAAWLAGRGIELGNWPVLLLTNLRVLGYVFNPVSYYYCLDAARNLRFVVAEVNNTFGETYCYLLDDLRSIGGRAFLAPRRKVFHVSPFIEMADVHYDWIVTPPGESLTVHINEFRAGEKFFDATLNLKRQPLTTGGLARALIRYPHMTGRTIFLIHWQALKLWWKEAPFFRKPEPPEQAWRRHG
jgi:DUF1365 family protein